MMNDVNQTHKMAKDFADHMVECVGETLSKSLFEWTMTWTRRANPYRREPESPEKQKHLRADEGSEVLLSYCRCCYKKLCPSLLTTHGNCASIFRYDKRGMQSIVWGYLNNPENKDTATKPESFRRRTSSQKSWKFLRRCWRIRKLSYKESHWKVRPKPTA